MKKVIISAALLAAAYAAFDLLGPIRHDLREFDPVRLAQLETGMWRSYYEHRGPALVRQLAETLRSQYGAPPLRSFVLAWRAGRAALVFQKGTHRGEYEVALPLLERYYEGIRALSATSFDPKRAARLELEWWIVHRERATRKPEELDQALAAWQSEMYGIPASRFAGHAHLRAEAMLLRDRLGEAGPVNDEGWSRIGALLAASWRSAWNVVNRG